MTGREQRVRKIKNKLQEMDKLRRSIKFINFYCFNQSLMLCMNSVINFVVSFKLINKPAIQLLLVKYFVDNKEHTTCKERQRTLHLKETATKNLFHQGSNETKKKTMKRTENTEKNQ